MSRERDNDFVKGVLGRTTGSGCTRACDLLPALTDGHLTDLDRQLVQSHLEHCPSCRQTAVVMGWLGPLLPAMAELDPGPAFTAAVLGRTTAAVDPVTRAVRAGQSVGPAGLMDRMGRWWEEQIFKPRFALQAAYVATVLLVLMTTVPGSPLKGAPGKALQMAQAGPGTLPLVGPVMTQVESSVTTWIDAGWSEVAAVGDGIEQEFASRARRSAAARTALSEHMDLALHEGRAGHLGQAGYEILQAARAGRDVWKNWWRELPSTDGI